MVEEAGELLKFLQNVDLQLANLLDIEGFKGSRRGSGRHNKNGQTRNHKQKTNRSSTTKTRLNYATKKRNHQIKSNERSKGRQRKSNTIDQISGAETPSSSTDHEILHQTRANQAHQQISDPSKLHQLNSTPSAESNSLLASGSLILTSITDELTLDHAAPISPVTHLSPIDTSIQGFSSSIHQPHYYNSNSKASLSDPYHLHDEFGAHEHMSISSTLTVPHQIGHPTGQQTQQRLDSLNQQHLVSQIPTDNSTSLTTNDWSNQHPHMHSHSHHHHQPQQQTQNSHHQQQQQQQQQQHHHPHQHSHGHLQLSHHHQHQEHQPHQAHQHNQHNHHHHHHQPQQHHQHHQSHHHHQQPQQQHHHPGQYHHLDQPWLIAGTSGNPEDALQLNTTDPTNALDQPLDEVQFSVPLYHHSYYNHQADHLDSFQHLNDDYTTNSSNVVSLTENSTSPISGMHRITSQEQSSSQQRQTHQQHHLHISGHLRMAHNESLGESVPVNNNNNLNSNNTTNNNTSTNDDSSNNTSYNHSHHSQISIHHHGDPLEHHGNYENQLSTVNNQQHNERQHQHHHMQHHPSLHNQNLIPPLLNGLESSGSMMQDINLVAASWPSPEDLYTI